MFASPANAASACRGFKYIRMIFEGSAMTRRTYIGSTIEQINLAKSDVKWG